MGKFLIGCCYYPEHWDDCELQEDILKIKNLGFNTVRMGEFSWSMYEKEEGKYDFSFLKKAVDSLKEQGIDVILGTPTAAPPKWLIDKHPEVLCESPDGVVLHHGSRQHHNHTSSVYLDYCAKITEAMVLAFKDCENVIGWQLDNEFNCHRNECYSEADDIAFRKWLENKYGTIEKLNAAWGNRFWSLEFNDFSQIQCQRKTTTHRNPALLTDYYLFLSDTIVNYATVQTKIIRKYMPEAFITHNGYFDNIDYKKLTENCLDFLSFDSYPAFLEGRNKGDSRLAAYRLESTRGCSEKMMIMEQQSGPGGQLSYLQATPLPSQIRLWTYQSIAHGAVGVLYFRYRTALYGAEQLWHGIYDHDKEENYRSREIRKISEELSRVGDIFLNQRQHNDVAILVDYHNNCNVKAEPFFTNDNWYIFTELNKKNIHSDIIYNLDGIEKYKVLVIPHIAIMNEKTVEKIKSFTDNGGIAIISARSGIKDEFANYRLLKGTGILKELTDSSVEWFTSQPEHSKQFVKMADKTYAVDKYYEMLSTVNGESVAEYTEGFCKDKPAIVKNGNVYYVGFYTYSSADVYTDIISQYVAVTHSINPMVEEIQLGAYRIYLNYSENEVDFKGYDVISQREIDAIEPYGVVLIKNN